MYRIIVFKRYYDKFIEGLSAEERRKIRDLLLIFSSGKQLPPQSIKYLREGIYEFRVMLMRNALRLFFIYDGAHIVVLLNGFRKKSPKTPLGEIRKAIKLKKAYYVEKEKEGKRTVVV